MQINVMLWPSCADPGIFSEGGGGVQARWLENSLDKFFLVLNLFYSLQRASNGFITEKTILSKNPEGVQHFSGGWGGGGVPTFSKGGPFYRNPYNLWFSRVRGGVWTPYPPSGSALDLENWAKIVLVSPTCSTVVRCLQNQWYFGTPSYILSTV